MSPVTRNASTRGAPREAGANQAPVVSSEKDSTVPSSEAFQPQSSRPQNDPGNFLDFFFDVVARTTSSEGDYWKKMTEGYKRLADLPDPRCEGPSADHIDKAIKTLFF